MLDLGTATINANGKTYNFSQKQWDSLPKEIYRAWRKKSQNLSFEEQNGEVLITYKEGPDKFTKTLYTKEKELELEVKAKAEAEVEARKAEDKKLTKAIRRYSFPSIGVMIGLTGIGLTLAAGVMGAAVAAAPVTIPLAVLAALTAVVCVAITIKAPKIAKDYNDFKRNSGSTKNQVKKYLLSKVKEYFKKPNAEKAKNASIDNSQKTINPDTQTDDVSNANIVSNRLSSTGSSGYGSQTSTTDVTVNVLDTVESSKNPKTSKFYENIILSERDLSAEEVKALEKKLKAESQIKKLKAGHSK